MPLESGPRQRDRLGRGLFGGTAFASAFLIFLVQPMVGRRIVPWFGGAPAVWTLCLAFYQTTLFAGYAYALCLIRYARPALQLPVHALVLGGALIALPVLPQERWRPSGAVEPTGAILAMLAVNVAIPFLALAATGPLLQAWFARRYPSRSPYPLYALSNLGSFLALLAYPFLIEPRLALSASGRLWSLAFVATAAAVLACAGLARHHDPSERPSAASGPTAPRTPRARFALWLLLPACAVVLMMGVTNDLCLDVASVPFLWMLPLGVYLATFVLCFASERTYRRIPCVLLMGTPILAELSLRASGLEGDERVLTLASSIEFHVVLDVLLLFGGCMVLHGELFRLRPPPRSLTTFYLCLSAGGALGGIFVGAGAPRIFDDYYELPLGVSLALLLLLAAYWQDARGWLGQGSPGWRRALALALAASLASQAAVQWRRRPDDVLHQERTFFGVLRVRQTGSGRSEQRQLFNGTTLHGVQFPGMPRRPTSYYGAQTGIGIALGQREPGAPSAIGVVGLGIGTLAAYGRPGDLLRFYEIDPAVIRLARDDRYFTYLGHSDAAVEVVAGDARISLASERERSAPSRFDFLIIDAFSSDAIPVHLLTREALAVYLDALKQTGLLAFHVSNRYFDLAPVLGRLGGDAGLQVVEIETASLRRYLSGRSIWVFLAREEERIRSLVHGAEDRARRLGLPPDAIQVRRPSPDQLARKPIWTDDHSDLVGSLRTLPIRVRADRGR